MSWDLLPRPEGVGRVTPNDTGFEATVTIPADDDGFFGRECPSCKAPFKMLEAEYDALPDEIALTCPYCGHCEHHQEFITGAQLARVEAAASALGEQWAHRELDAALGRVFGRPRRSARGSSGVRITYTPGSPPPIGQLPDAFGDVTRSVVECTGCGNHHAVYSVSVYCPVCGPRSTMDTVLEAIVAVRLTLRLEDNFADRDEREQLRAAGVFERLAVDALKSVTSLFETGARGAFARHVEDHETLIKGKGNLFQRPDDTAQLFLEHAGLNVVELTGGDRWGRLKRAVALRHAYVHNSGLIDEKLLAQVPDLGLGVGQRVVVRRAEAEQALDDLEVIIRRLG
jgi:hypothetical protein